MVFDTYKDIFNKRGKAYHEAMALAPDARKQEFDLILEQAQIKEGQTICDMPSGGGYLQYYLPEFDIDLISVESSREFFELIPN